MTSGPRRPWRASFYQLSMVELARADGRFDVVVAGVDVRVRGVRRRERVMPLPMILGAAIGAAADVGGGRPRRRRAGESAGVAAHAADWLQQFHATVRGTEAEGGPGPFVEALLTSADAEATRLSGRSDPGAWRVAVDRWSAIDAAPAARLRHHPARGSAAGRGRRPRRGQLATAAAVGPRRRSAPNPSVEEARSISRRAGSALDGMVAAAWFDTRKASAATLTRRERAVIRLVADGRTKPRDRRPPLHRRSRSASTSPTRWPKLRGAVSVRGGGGRRAAGLL